LEKQSGINKSTPNLSYTKFFNPFVAGITSEQNDHLHYEFFPDQPHNGFQLIPFGFR